MPITNIYVYILIFLCCREQKEKQEAKDRYWKVRSLNTRSSTTIATSSAFILRCRSHLTHTALAACSGQDRPG